MSRDRAITISALVLALWMWLYFIFKVPTLDFDESLYRRVADSMKAAHNPWYLMWDERPLFHKPPIFYWLVWGSSLLVDGATATISSIAARIPSFLATIGILAYLYQSGKRFGASVGRNAAFAFLCGFFPLVTATSVLFDPLQTLCLMPSLVIPAILFFKGGKLLRSDWILWGLSLFAASATKGLNGIVVPTFAFGIHCLIAIRSIGWANSVRLVLKFTGFVFFPALFLTGLFFGILDRAIGPTFTHEFIWVQHFERSTSTMEQHSGTFFYHFLIIFFLGGTLIPLLLFHWGRTRPSFLKYGFSLTYALSFLIIFGLSATKLPHYSWPAWPALALFTGLIFTLPDAAPTSEIIPLPRFLRPQSIAGYFPVLTVGLLALILLLTSKALLLHMGTPSRSAQILLNHFDGFNGFETLCFLGAVLIAFIYEVNLKKFVRSLEASAIVSAALALLLCMGLTRTVTDFMVKPYLEIAQSIKNDGAVRTDCIRDSGALSPTLSLALAPELIHNRCEPGIIKYLIAPEWKSGECEERGLKIIDQRSYLVLCKRG